MENASQGSDGPDIIEALVAQMGELAQTVDKIKAQSVDNTDRFYKQLELLEAQIAKVSDSQTTLRDRVRGDAKLVTSLHDELNDTKSLLLETIRQVRDLAELAKMQSEGLASLKKEIRPTSFTRLVVSSAVGYALAVLIHQTIM